MCVLNQKSERRTKENLHIFLNWIFLHMLVLTRCDAFHECYSTLQHTACHVICFNWDHVFCVRITMKRLNCLVRDSVTSIQTWHKNTIKCSVRRLFVGENENRTRRIRFPLISIGIRREVSACMNSRILGVQTDRAVTPSTHSMDDGSWAAICARICVCVCVKLTQEKQFQKW